MKLSIIMRTKNADWVVEQALRALHSQSLREFELIVIDSGSSDRTLDIVKKYSPILLQIPPSAYIPGAVLNQAIEASSGNVLVFQNSDTVPLTPFALRELVHALDEPRVVASFARQIPRPEAATWVRRDYEISFPAEGDAPQWMPLSLPFAAMHRFAWKQHRFHTAAFGSEDIEWGLWARRNGYRVRYVPSALVMHSHNYSLREAFGRRFIEGEADAFIKRDKDSVAGLSRRIIGSTTRDIIFHASVRDLRGLCEAPFRRTAFHCGYYFGHRHGERRIENNAADGKLAQRIVLEKFGGSGAREDRRARQA